MSLASATEHDGTLYVLCLSDATENLRTRLRGLELQQAEAGKGRRFSPQQLRIDWC